VTASTQTPELQAREKKRAGVGSALLRKKKKSHKDLLKRGVAQHHPAILKIDAKAKQWGSGVQNLYDKQGERGRRSARMAEQNDGERGH